MGREVIRVGLVIHVGHSGEGSTIEAADLSERPIAITHVHPARLRPAPRKTSDGAIPALMANGSMIGFSPYPPHLKGRFGMGRIGIDSDLVQDQPDSITA